MKAQLINDKTAGPAGGYLAKKWLTAAAEQTGLTITENAAQAALVIVTGHAPSTTEITAGQRVWCGELQQALSEPDRFLATACAQAKAVQKNAAAVRIVAVTACPTGVAHTFMAAEAIEAEAARRGWWVKVETRGSVGAGNPLTPQEVADADVVIVAADIDVDLTKFTGKRLYRTTTGLALKKTAQELDNAINNAQVFQPQRASSTTVQQKTDAIGAYRHLLTGVSYMLPMVVAGGLCIALSFAFGISASDVPGSLAAALKQIGGGSAFVLMVPVLAGYIAFSIADRPGLTPGLIGGMLANSISAGFLGGIIAGFIAGYAAKLINNRIRLPQSMDALKPVLIIPLLASLITGLLMIYVVGGPIAVLMNSLTGWLAHMGTANAVLLGAVLGGMMCSDMGGPINKVAYAFGVGLLSSQTYTPMAAIMAAGMVPPLAMGLATLMARKKYLPGEREGGKAALVLGLCFISEGAIPFAARDPVRVLLCCIVGGAVTGAISMAVGAKLMAPHGGLFVLLIPGAITPVGGYLLAIIIGTVLAGGSYALLKRAETPPISD